MDGRERWRALQARLAAARAAADRGDRGEALAAITAALDLDPDFLAAHALRDRLLAADAAPPLVSFPAADAAASRGISADGYARFQDRAKRRRLDGRLAAARSAMARGRLSEAAAALDEAIELDPHLPELRGLTVEFDRLRRGAPPRRGRWVAAAGAFALTIFAASWLREPPSIAARPVPTARVTLPPVAPISQASIDLSAVGTTGSGSPDLTVDVPPEPTEAIAEAIPPAIVKTLPPPAPDVVASPPAPQVQPQTQAQTPSQTSSPTRLAIEPPANAPVAAPVPLKIDRPDDSALVQQAIQRYRRAYEGLDARSAQAVWPAVNEAALARAFEGLESQTLTFDGCDVYLRVESAMAICKGSARYVPKVGSREQRVEPRTWTFALHKDGADWKIDSAQVER